MPTIPDALKESNYFESQIFMKRLNPVLVLIVTILLQMNLAYANETKIYKHVDQNGIIHYSSTKQPGKSYQELNVGCPECASGNTGVKSKITSLLKTQDTNEVKTNADSVLSQTIIENWHKKYPDVDSRIELFASGKATNQDVRLYEIVTRNEMMELEQRLAKGQQEAIEASQWRKGWFSIFKFVNFTLIEKLNIACLLMILAYILIKRPFSETLYPQLPTNNKPNLDIMKSKMPIMKWIASKTGVGGTARWAAKSYNMIVFQYPNISKVELYGLLIQNRALLKVEEKNLLMSSIVDLVGLRELVAALLAVQAGFNKNTPETRYMFMEVIDNELLKHGVPPHIVFGEDPSEHTG